MRPRFQADEDFNAKILTGILRREPAIDFRTAAEAGLLGRSDPDVLANSAASGRILVSHDHRTLPDYFGVLIQSSESPGLLIVSQQFEIARAIDELVLI